MAPDPRSVLSVRSRDGAALGCLVYSNAGRAEFAYHPDHFEVSFSPGPWRARALNLDELRLDLPSGWLSIPASVRPFPAHEPRIGWLVYPRGEPSGYHVPIQLTGFRSQRPVVSEKAVLPIEIRGHSQFDPAQHALPVANTVGDLGQIQPQEAVFAQTYDRVLFAKSFFAGLYRAIVFLDGGQGGYRGGLCAGMARLALERSLGAPRLSAADLLTEIQILHGRQLTDRALLAASPWFLAPSPRRAYGKFRRSLLTQGWSDICFDIGVPRPWRRDLLTALVRMGHVVVPYAFTQAAENRARVWVYDPNHPAGPEAQRSVIEFDLDANTYAYRRWAHHDDRSTTIIAVPQAAYRDGRSAILASLANLVLYPRSIRRSPASITHWSVRTLSAAVIGVAVLVLRRRRADVTDRVTAARRWPLLRSARPHGANR